MRQVFLSRVLIGLAIVGAYGLGRLSPPEKGAPAAHSILPSPVQEGGWGASGPASGEATPLARGFAAAETLDPTLKIEGVVATVANEPPGLSRIALLHAVLQRITKENWHAALVTAWNARNDGKISEDEMRYILQRLGEVAGPSFLTMVKPKDPVKDYETHNGRWAMAGWAAADPAAAKAWLADVPAGKYREGMVWGYVLGTGTHDAAEGLRAMQELSVPEQYRLLCRTLDDSNGHRYQPLAEAWLSANAAPGTPPVRAEDDAVSQVFASLLSAQMNAGAVIKRADKFIAWADSLADKPWFGPQTISTVANEFARRNEAAHGLEWVDRVTATQPSAADAAVRNLMANLTYRDPANAATLLNDYGASPHYDQAVEAFLRVQRGRLDAATAQAWAGSVRDEKLRSSLLQLFR